METSIYYSVHCWLYSLVGKWKMDLEKNDECSIGNIADIADVILDHTSLEEVLRVLVEKIPHIFSEPENITANIELMDQKCEAFSCEHEELVLKSDIVVNGKNEGTIEVAIRNKNRANKEDAALIEEYKRLLGFISRMISTFFEKRKRSQISRPEKRK